MLLLIFLTNLGSNFLSFYYSCFIESNEGLVVCVEEDGKIIGFAAATKRCKGFNASLIKIILVVLLDFL